MVLLCGPLTKSNLESAWQEIIAYQEQTNGGPQSVTLVINSEGDGYRALEFVDRMEKSGITFSAKIYRANSGAALIAMAAKEREMVAGGELEIHLGSVTIEANEIDDTGQVTERLRIFLTAGREKTLALMAKCGFKDQGPHIDTLFATNWLLLTADECLALGIVKRII